MRHPLFVSKVSSSKTNLLFLHGWQGTWQSWFPILKKLKGKYNLYALDLPGFGQKPLSHPWNLDDYCQYVKNFIQKHRIKQPILIGHSFGGAISSRLASDNHNFLSGLVLVDAASLRHPFTPKKLFLLFIAKAFKSLFKLPPLQPFYQNTRRSFYTLLGLKNADYTILEDNPVLKKTLGNILKQDQTTTLAHISIPTLIVWGEKDTATPLTEARKINNLISGSRLIVYPNSGHFPYLDRQEQFVKNLISFIKHDT